MAPLSRLRSVIDRAACRWIGWPVSIFVRASSSKAEVSGIVRLQRRLIAGGRPARHVTAATRTIGVEHCLRSEEHTSELQSLMRISYAVFCLKKQNKDNITEQ